MLQTIFPIALIVLSSVSYHLIQKLASPTANPALVLLLAYLAGALGSAILFLIYPLGTPLEALREVRWSGVLLGVAILGIEIGFLLAYRASWSISTASLVANLTVALVLIPVGLIVFKDSLTPHQPDRCRHLSGGPLTGQSLMENQEA
jgi:hypothetical protein